MIVGMALYGLELWTARRNPQLLHSPTSIVALGAILVRGLASLLAWELVHRWGTGDVTHGWLSVVVAVTIGTALFSHEYVRFSRGGQEVGVGLKDLFGRLVGPIDRVIASQCRNADTHYAQSLIPQIHSWAPNQIRRALLDEVEALTFSGDERARAGTRSSRLIRGRGDDGAKAALLVYALELGLREFVGRLPTTTP
jgi:hypothetical protein